MKSSKSPEILRHEIWSFKQLKIFPSGPSPDLQWVQCECREESLIINIRLGNKAEFWGVECHFYIGWMHDVEVVVYRARLSPRLGRAPAEKSTSGELVLVLWCECAEGWHEWAPRVRPVRGHAVDNGLRTRRVRSITWRRFIKAERIF